MYTIRRKFSEHQDVTIKCKINDFYSEEGIVLENPLFIFQFLNSKRFDCITLGAWITYKQYYTCI